MARGLGRRALALRLLLGGAFAAAAAGVGVAALYDPFAEEPALAEAELADLRGGFTLPKMPEVEVSFGFVFDTVVKLPAGAGVPASALKPAFVVLGEEGGGGQFASRSSITFTDPARAKVVTKDVVRAGGAVVSKDVSRRKVDLTKNTIELEVGQPGRATVTHVVDADQVTTMIQNVVSGARLETNDSLAITLKGIPDLQRRLPSRGMVRTMDSLRQSLTLR